MPDIYVSSSGSNTAPYDTWAKAATTWQTGIGALAAGDRLLVDSNFTQTYASGNLTFTFPGTVLNPNTILSLDIIDDSYAPGAEFLITAGSLTVNGSFYARGVTWKCPITSVSNYSVTIYGGSVVVLNVLEDCDIGSLAGGTGASLSLGNNANIDPPYIRLINCNLYLPKRLTFNGGRMDIIGGAIAGTNSSLTEMLVASSSGEGTRINVVGLDMSALPASADLVGGNISESGVIYFDSCRMPAGWSGAYWNQTTTALHAVVEAVNCHEGDVNYHSYKGEYTGTILTDTGIYRDSGASDGTTPLSWKMTTNANAAEVFSQLRTYRMEVWNETVGSPITLTAHFVHDSATNLQDDEIWLECVYPNNASYVTRVLETDRRANPAVAPSDHAASIETWTGTSGFSNENKQKPSVTVTPQQIGWISLQVALSTASKTIYVCPKVEVS